MVKTRRRGRGGPSQLAHPKTAVALAGAMFGAAGAAGATIVRRLLDNRRLESQYHARFQAIIEGSRDYFFVVDPDGWITYRSPSVDEATRHIPKPRNVDDLLNLLDPEAADKARRAFFGDEYPSKTMKVSIPTADGPRWIELHLNNQLDNPVVRGLIITGRDITDQELLATELVRQAHIDELTGLPNRRAVVADTETIIGRATVRGQGVGLLLVDLDGFKAVNDTLGHPVGDELLRQVAARLNEATRRGETVARIGGDEFALTVENVTAVEAEALARRLLEALRHPFFVDEHNIVIGASIGIAVSPPRGLTGSSDGVTAELIRRADIALYEAKHRGRGRWMIFDDEMAKRADVEARLVREVEAGFDNQEFYLVYQPLVETSSERTVAFEALMRWNSPVLGQVAPLTFIPVAERSGAIVRMGRWALTEACRQIATWNAVTGTRSLSVAVNISLLQLLEDDLPGFISELLAETDVDATQLQLEITEKTITHDPAAVIAPLNHLRTLGVRIVLDDFGTGYSSMVQLQDLPIDCIKIDPALTGRLDNPTESPYAVLGAMIDLAQALKVTVVAEGVEEAEQLAELRRHDVQLAQGYLFARPLDVAAAEALLRNQVELQTPSRFDDRGRG